MRWSIGLCSMAERGAIVVIDDDLGRSGATVEGRLVAEVGLGHVGLVLASLTPTVMPSTSRRPSLFTPAAMITATEMMRPFWRSFTYVA